MTSPPADREPAAPANLRQPPPLTVSAGATVATFTWESDRWRHAITVDGRPFAASLEDAADGRQATWPASPPLVELSPHEAPQGRALLAVGLAGRSHFSAAIAPHPRQPDTLLVEVACRIREAPPWLGSTYLVGAARLRITPPPPPGDLPATIRWTYTIGPDGIRPVPPAGASTVG